MLLGIDNIAKAVFAYTEREQFKTWNQACRRPSKWQEIPKVKSTVPDIQECKKCR